MNQFNCIRSFLPVGQGAFYSECFTVKGNDNMVNNRINIIYDCGSSSNIEIVKKQVEQKFSKGEKIDALFISHLDEDHVNGIPFLLKYCDVKKIFFPLISDDTKILLKIGFECNGSFGFGYKFLIDPVNAISSLTLDNNPNLFAVSVDKVDKEKQKQKQKEKQKQKQKEKEKEIKNIIIKSGENIFDYLENDNLIQSNWYLIPFNFKSAERSEQLLKNLRNEFRENINQHDLNEMWKNNNVEDKRKIKESYKKVKGNLNDNSMTLFSGMNPNISYNYKLCINHCSCFAKQNQYDLFMDYCKYFEFRMWCCSNENKIKRFEVGCLYLGDFNAKSKKAWLDLKNAYEEYWKNVGCIQIPHHGSIHSFNNEIAEMNVIHIISAGISNRYRHPHKIVVRKLIQESKDLHIVNEIPKSLVNVQINFY